MTDKSKYTLEEKVAWLEGAFEQMEKRVKALEQRREPAPSVQARSGFDPDMIGTVTIATASFGLMVGIPLGIPGAVIGAIFGFMLGISVANDRRKRK